MNSRYLNYTDVSTSSKQAPFLSNKDVAPNLSARWCFCPQTYGGSMNLLDLFMPRWSLSSNLVAVPLNSCSWFLGCLGKTNKRKQKEAGRRWIFNEFFCMEFRVKLEGDFQLWFMICGISTAHLKDFPLLRFCSEQDSSQHVMNQPTKLSKHS